MLYDSTFHGICFLIILVLHIDTYACSSPTKNKKNSIKPLHLHMKFEYLCLHMKFEYLCFPLQGEGREGILEHVFVVLYLRKVTPQQGDLENVIWIFHIIIE